MTQKRALVVRTEPVSYAIERGPLFEYFVPILLKRLTAKTRGKTGGIKQTEIEHAISYLTHLRVKQIVTGTPVSEAYPTILSDFLVSIQPVQVPELLIKLDTLDYDEKEMQKFRTDYELFLFACQAGSLPITNIWPSVGVINDISMLALSWNDEKKSLMCPPAINPSTDTVQRRMWITLPTLALYGVPVYEILDEFDLQAIATNLVVGTEKSGIVNQRGNIAEGGTEQA